VAESPTRSRGVATRLLGAVEAVGNRLPDPATLFVIVGACILLASAWGAAAGWAVPDPRDPAASVTVRSLLDADGLRWVFTNVLRNFTGFPPLAIVLVAMLGIGVAERTGLFPALLKLLVAAIPGRLLVPAVIFIGICSNAASDAGYVVLPPLAAGVFAKAGRSPLVGIACATFGVASGFSANLVVTSLDPLLSSLTEAAARIVDPEARVLPTCNYWFMFASTFVLTGVGWFVTARIVEPRFGAAEVAAQIATGGIVPGRERISPAETRGLLAALAGFLLAAGGFAAMILVPGGPLTGEVPRPGTGALVPAWSEALVPMILVLFLVPGICYGLATREIRSDRDVARRMGESMSAMGTYLVLAFFAGQAIAWFAQSNLATFVSAHGAQFVRNLGVGPGPMLVALVLTVAVINLLVSSASAKWALLGPVLVPMLAQAGMRPELVQAAYRVGDSCTNSIAPLSPYLGIILVAIRRFTPEAGLGTLIALLLPYTVVSLAVWTAMLVAWNAAGWPLGFGG